MPSRATSGGFSRNKRGPDGIGRELVAKSTGPCPEFSLDDRVFHQKFGYEQRLKSTAQAPIAFEKPARRSGR